MQAALYACWIRLSAFTLTGTLRLLRQTLLVLPQLLHCMRTMQRLVKLCVLERCQRSADGLNLPVNKLLWTISWLKRTQYKNEDR